MVHKTGQVSEPTLADHGLVLMFRPFRDNWGEPIAVFASSGPTTSVMLGAIVLKAMKLLEESEAIVDALVCDGAQPNRGLWKILGVSGDNVFDLMLVQFHKHTILEETPRITKTIKIN